MAEELKVALVGSAPSSLRLAPFGDPSWKIWGCSPGVYGVATRVDEWFELHLYEPGQPWFSPEYCQWLAALPGRGVRLWVGHEGAREKIPGSVVLPHAQLSAKYDDCQWFCTSSLFWMMATAIEMGAKKIGLWGVDMAASEEYEMQRAGIHYLTYIARGAGIEVGCPPESDLFTPRFRYGIDEWTHSFRKVRARSAELTARKAAAMAAAQASAQEAAFLAGAIDDLRYMGETWAEKTDRTGPLPLPKLEPELVKGKRR
jgi:hypothetical protein